MKKRTDSRNLNSFIVSAKFVGAVSPCPVTYQKDIDFDSIFRF